MKMNEYTGTGSEGFEPNEPTIRRLQTNQELYNRMKRFTLLHADATTCSRVSK